jgi:hypothetical protein
MYNTGNSSKNVTTTSIVDGTISNADVDASAAIVQSKLATLAITDSEVANDALSGDKIDSGTIGNLTSLGVGVEPSYKLEINSGTGNNVALFESTDSNANILIKDNNTTANDSIRVSAQGDNLNLISKETGSSIIFNPENAERVRVTADGLTFNGDTATANALSDYESGSWTPDLNFGGANTGVAYTHQTGLYVKTGGVVNFSLRIRISDEGSETGNATIEGLPYAPSSSLNGYVNRAYTAYTQSITASAPAGVIIDTNDYIRLYESLGTSPATLTEADFGALSYLTIVGSYQTA